MSTVFTRAGKGSVLTNAEADASITNLNADKLERNGSNSMTGPLGMGVTPTAGWSNIKPIQGLGLSLYSPTATLAALASNTYTDGTNNRYVATGAATAYLMNAGVHSWGSAASGTAGNVASYTFGMNLDANGRWMLNRITPTFAGGGGRMAVDYLGSAEWGLAIRETGAGATSFPFVIMTSTDTVVGSISHTTTTTSFNTSSDIRLKTGIFAANDSGLVVDAIRIVRYDWKTGGHVDYGVIAQELHDVFPLAVTAGDNGAEITQQWQVDYSKLVPLLVKEVQTLRARMAGAEAEIMALKARATWTSR